MSGTWLDNSFAPSGLAWGHLGYSVGVCASLEDPRCLKSHFFERLRLSGPLSLPMWSLQKGSWNSYMTAQGSKSEWAQRQEVEVAGVGRPGPGNQCFYDILFITAVTVHPGSRRGNVVPSLHGRVSKNLWPSLICHPTTTLLLLLLLLCIHY